MGKKRVTWSFFVIVLIGIIAGSFIIKNLTSTKYGKLSILKAVTLSIDNCLNPSSLSGKSITQIRNLLNKSTIKLNAKSIPFLNIKNMNIVVASNQVPVRIYTPDNGEKFPVIIYCHGGSWISGNLDTHDNICRKLSKKTKALVVSVDYRLAPENPFPAGLNDVYDVLQWVSKNSESIHGDSEYICVAGDSAGGNLAAAICQMARDKGGPYITCQVLIYPSTNIFELNSKSWSDFGHDYILTRENSQKYLSLYTPKIEDRESPYASPILAKHFKGLPDSLVITAQFDPLKDEGEAYAQRLKEAGISSVFTRYKGVTHGFISMDSIFKQAEEALNQISQYLQNEFDKDHQLPRRKYNV